MGLGLAGFYLVPAAYEQSWVNISQALSSGLQPSQNFLYAVIADAEHNAFNRIASNAAVLMIILTGIFAVVAFPRNKQADSQIRNERYLERIVRHRDHRHIPDAAHQQHFLVHPAQIAFRAISLALDVHSGNSVCVLCGGDHRTKNERLPIAPP